MTNSPAFTPGPWGKNCSHIYAPDGAIIATVSNPGSKPSDYPLVANRDLMAAAPDLYDDLAVLIQAFGQSSEHDLWKRAKTTLAKARGEL